jgi:hypothetical protein
MRVYNPRKDLTLLRDALKALYLLKQAIDHQSGTADNRMQMVDDARLKIQAALDIMEEDTR